MYNNHECRKKLKVLNEVVPNCPKVTWACKANQGTSYTHTLDQVAGKSPSVRLGKYHLSLSFQLAAIFLHAPFFGLASEPKLRWHPAKKIECTFSGTSLQLSQHLCVLKIYQDSITYEKFTELRYCSTNYEKNASIRAAALTASSGRDA